MQDYRKLLVWRDAHALALEVYRATRSFPADERYGMVTQLRRSVCSVPTNLAEGRMRSSERSFAQFVEIASGSASETDYLLLLATDLGYLDTPEHEQLATQLRSIRKQLSALRRTLLARNCKPKPSAVRSRQRPMANGQRLS